jgi:hypothetical protein
MKQLVSQHGVKLKKDSFPHKKKKKNEREKLKAHIVVFQKEKKKTRNWKQATKKDQEKT